MDECPIDFCSLIIASTGRFNKLFRLKRVDGNQRIKMLQIAFQYTLPKLKQEVDEVEDLPLFVD